MGRFPAVPASFFSMVLGVAGLGTDWRVAATIWPVPSWIGECVLLIATMLWGLILSFYVGKWMFARDDALEEFRHPVQCCFIGLAGVSTLLVALAALPYSARTAEALAVCGCLFQLGFGVYRGGSLLKGGRDPRDTTPILHLPLVAGNFVAAIALGALGQPFWGVFFFGGGLFSWLALESVVLHRLYTVEPMALPLRPSLGVQLAPPAVGAVAWLGLNGGAADLFAQVLIGYAMLQLLIALRLLRWICKQPFTASYWSFSFGITALPLAMLLLMKRGAAGGVPQLAVALFVLANVVVATLLFRTLYIALLGRLLPPRAAQVALPVSSVTG